MQNPLKIAPPPARPVAVTPEGEGAKPAIVQPRGSKKERRLTSSPPAKFQQVKEDEMVQFNKRVPRHVSDGFEMLAIRTRQKVPQLVAEALALLEERYGSVS